MLIRPIEPADHETLWSVMEETIRAGETYAAPMQMSRDDGVRWWTEGKESVLVAEIGGQVVGTYYLKPNQLGNGSHVANAGYLVAPFARGQGVAKRLCEHSLSEARHRGYLAMQFNFVVETNETAVRLWQRLGFQIVATVPRAFRHPTRGLVGAHVMWQSLEAD
ncbi:putative acetyltransferase [Caulifigura coniformis]|uniref:Putative acetyltransferase n=1 Tax=Caulifigura coniformis TaxID=2527983 RepID=A0A517SCB1_9PLAN|nr:GNAT family N-acetyltransferase [Caulifigura coniformis]QDT53769.1 putative acetyltransferase [Caulifigura coniformis]